MCFRPAAAQKPITCPSCEKKIPIVGGYKPKECPHCKAELPSEKSK